MKPISVLLITQLGTAGGTELSTLTLAKGLKQAGHQVYVMCNTHPLVEDFKNAGAEIVLANMKKNPLLLFKDSYKMHKFIAINKIDIIHYQSAFLMLMSLLYWRFSMTGKIKIVWTCRGTSKNGYLFTKFLSSFFISYIIANCNAERNKLISLGFSQQKIRTIYNSPNIAIPEYIIKNEEILKELSIDHDTPIVGTASRLSPERGVEMFIESAAIILRDIPNVKFVIAGGGNKEANLRQQARNLNIEQQTIFLGHRRDMDRVYSIMDVFVNPILDKYDVAGTGNTNAEAMAFGKPVIASDVSGISEIVMNGITGFLVPPGNPQKMAEFTLTLLKDKNLAIKMGLAGKERIQNQFSLDRLVSEMEKVYLSLIE